MDTLNSFDLNYRPESYWSPTDVKQAILADVKGDLRREMIRDLLDRGVDIEAGILAENSPATFRQTLERMNPEWMGGEYLPDHRPGEVEIARIVLASTTRDVYSIRARKGKARIYYRIVDEYDLAWKFSPKTSKVPLMMAQLIRMIDTADDGSANLNGSDFTDNLRDWQDSPEDALGFVTVTSEVYPELQAYYEAKERSWYAAQAGRPRPT